jgi:hypothetical protein
MYSIQHWFICRPDSIGLEDAGIEPSTVLLRLRQSDALTARLDLIQIRKCAKYEQYSNHFKLIVVSSGAR